MDKNKSTADKGTSTASDKKEKLTHAEERLVELCKDYVTRMRVLGVDVLRVDVNAKVKPTKK